MEHNRPYNSRLPRSIFNITGHEQIKSVMILFTVFLAIDIPTTRLPRVIQFNYENYSLSGSFIGFTGLAGLAITVISLYALYMGRVLTLKWCELEFGGALRYFVCFLAALMTWYVATLAHNHYFNQSYYAERAIAVILLGLLVWRPVFIIPLCLIVYLLLWQIHNPVLANGSHLAHKLHVFHVINLFSAWLLIHALKRKPPARDFLFLTCCLIAAAYWAPAFKKLTIGWLYNGELYTMLLNAHAHGWLSYINPDVFLPVLNVVANFDIPMRIFVIGIEAGCLFIAWKRGLTVFLLTALALFHCGVFLLYGYFFWTWIALNAAAIALLLTARRSQRLSFYTPPYLMLSIALILTGNYWCKPSPLGWIDARLTYTYRYEAITGAGQSYDVPFGFFEPYGDIFTMANFSYLSQSHNFLVNPYGTTNRLQADALRSASSLQQVEKLENQIGWKTFNAEKSKIFHDFMQRYFVNTNQSATDNQLYSLSPPRQFWSHPRGAVYTGQEKVTQVIVKEVTTLFDGKSLREIRNLPVMVIDIPDRAEQS